MSGWSDYIADRCEQLIRGAFSPTQPIEVDAVGGERLPDLLGAALIHAVSPRMLRVFEEAGATGYSTIPVILRHKKLGLVVSGYSGLIVYGRGGPLDENRMQPLKRSGGTIISCNGYYICQARWDGSDVFLIDGLGVSVWVSERVAAALQKVRPRLRNVALTPNTQSDPNVASHTKVGLTIGDLMALRPDPEVAREAEQ